MRKEAQNRQSAEHSTNSQNELLADQQDICLVAEHQEILNLDQPIGTSIGTPGSVVIDQICDENIQLFMRCEEYRQKETELKRTVEDLGEELKEVQRRCAHLSSLLEAKRKQQKSVVGK